MENIYNTARFLEKDIIPSFAPSVTETDDVKRWIDNWYVSRIPVYRYGLTLIKDKSTNIYEFVKQNFNEFDTSDYSDDNQFATPRVNRKVLGVMKDECAGQIMQELIGIRSKLYNI